MTKPRAVTPTVACIDNYCQYYRKVFPEVRSFEYFKYIMVGLISDLKRKTLPAISEAVGLQNAQGLHHFLADSPWEVEELRKYRLERLKQALNGREFILCIDETGDRKKGHSTDYVARQYIGNLGKIENGIVSVNAYGVLDNTTFPLLFEVYKPKGRLKETDKFYTKPQLAVNLLQQLREMGFAFNLALADCVYGESSAFVRELQKQGVDFIVAIRSNHGVWMSEDQEVSCTPWREFERQFSRGDSEKRYLREIVFGTRGKLHYYEITTDWQTLPQTGTWYVASNLSGEFPEEVGNGYGFRTWIEYGFKQVKNELGWADFRLTRYADIEKWWEIVYCAHLFISLQTGDFSEEGEAEASRPRHTSRPLVPANFPWLHPQWEEGNWWHNILHNVRLILQPYLCYQKLIFWIQFLPLKPLCMSLGKLMKIADQFPCFVPD